MHLLASVVENVGVMILTIAVLLGGIYLWLMVLQVGMKFKSRGQEEERLAGLWQETLSKPWSTPEADHHDP